MEDHIFSTQKQQRERAIHSLDEVSQSWGSTRHSGQEIMPSTSMGERSKLGVKPRFQNSSDNETFSLRERRNSWSEGRFTNDLTYRAAAESLAQMIEQKEADFKKKGINIRNEVRFAPPVGSSFNSSLPPKGRLTSSSTSFLPGPNDLMQVIQNQGAYLHMLEAENKFCREELHDLKQRCFEVVAENRGLYEDLKSGVAAGLIQMGAEPMSNYRRAMSSGDIGDDLRTVYADTPQKFQSELERINAMHVSKGRRLESQLNLAQEDVKKLEEELNYLRKQFRERDSLTQQSDAYRMHLSGVIVNPDNPQLYFNQNNMERTIRERDELAELVGQLKFKLERMKQREDELCQQISDSIKTVEQAKMEENQALIQSRHLTEELENMQQRFEEGMQEAQRRIEEERKFIIQELDATRGGGDDYNNEIAHKSNHIEKLEQKLRHSEGKYEEARLQLVAYEKDYSKTRDDLQAALSRATLHRDQAISELGRMRENLLTEQRDREQEKLNYKSEIADLRSRLTTTERNLLSANEDRLKLTNDNQGLLKELNYIKLQKGNLEKVHNQEANELRQSSLNRENELTAQILSLEACYDNNSGDLHDIIEKHAHLITKLREECRINVHQMESLTLRFQDQIHQLRAENHHLTEKGKRLDSRNQELEAQCIEHAKTHQSMRKRLKQIDEKYQQQSQTINELLAKQNSLNQEKQILSKEIEFLQSQIPIRDSDANLGSNKITLDTKMRKTPEPRLIKA